MLKVPRGEEEEDFNKTAEILHHAAHYWRV